jgi:hypothetical protein
MQLLHVVCYLAEVILEMLLIVLEVLVTCGIMIVEVDLDAFLQGLETVLNLGLYLLPEHLLEVHRAIGIVLIVLIILRFFHMLIGSIIDPLKVLVRVFNVHLKHGCCLWSQLRRHQGQSSMILFDIWGV